MAYHDDLLAHSLALVHTQPQSELTLRRAVSSAYYAVFHLLIFGDCPLGQPRAENYTGARLRPQSDEIGLQ